MDEARSVASRLLQHYLDSGAIDRADRAELYEGAESSCPGQAAIVRKVRSQRGTSLELALRRGGRYLLFRAPLKQGQLPETFEWSFGKRPSVSTPSGLVLRGKSGQFRQGDTAFPLDSFDWRASADVIEVRAESLDRLRSDLPGSGAFRLAPELPLEDFGAPTDSDDFELRSMGPKSGEIRFRVPDERAALLLHVRGTLYLGDPRHETELSFGGRPIVFWVDEGLVIRGNVSCALPGDRIYFIVRGPCPLSGPSDGACGPAAQLGLASAVRIQAFVIAGGDVRVGAGGARVIGGLLLGGGLEAAFETAPLRLEIVPDARVLTPRQVLPGLPISREALRRRSLGSLQYVGSEAPLRD